MHTYQKWRKKKYMTDLGGKDHDACSGLSVVLFSVHIIRFFNPPCGPSLKY